MIKKNKTLKNIILVLSVLILIGLIVFIVGRSFGYFNYAKKGDTVNVVSISGLGVDILNNSEDALNLVNVYPMYDNEGLELDPFEFNLLNSTNRSFDIRLKIENDSEKESECSGCTFIGTNYIRYAYSVDNGQYSEPANLGANSNIVLTDTITSHGTKKISIKIWIDKDAPNSIQQAYFYGKVVVEGELSACTLAVGDSFDFNYTGDVQEFEVSCSGYYKIEAWGAQGGTYGNTAYTGGLGGYTAGIASLTQDDNIYIYVGGAGQNTGIRNEILAGGYNGGGNSSNTSYPDTRSSSSGGGATDIRYFGNNIPSSSDLAWDSTLGLNSRIMVAGGGGGNGYWTEITAGGAAGGLISNQGTYSTQRPATHMGGASNQVSGGAGGYEHTELSGFFGKGGNGNTSSNNMIGPGGGAGYYGGGAAWDYGAGGAGGSSYISGHTGCVAIASGSTSEPRAVKQNGCTTGTTDNNCSIHYSQLYFINTKMIDGAGYNWTSSKGTYVGQPQPDGTVTSGHAGNGYARITYLGNNPNLVTIYSAVSDEVYYYDSDNQKVVLGTTDSTGKLLTSAVAPDSSITLYSSVAKDPANLSVAYSKAFNAISSFSSLYLMPDNAIYWYGNERNEITGGWEPLTLEGGEYASGTKETNYFHCRTKSVANVSTMCQFRYLTSQPLNLTPYSTMYVVANGYTNGDWSGLMLEASPAKDTSWRNVRYTDYHNPTLSQTDLSLVTYNISSYNGNYYLRVGDGNGSQNSIEVYADVYAVYLN